MSVVSGYSLVMSYRSATPSSSTDSGKRNISSVQGDNSTTQPTISSTTPPPTPPPPPPSPPPHKHDYERRMTEGRVSDADIERLKNVMRELRNSIASPLRPQRRCFNAADPPRIPPKTNETARIRMEWRAYRLYQRCGAVLEAPAIEPEQAEATDEEEALSTRRRTKLLDAMQRQAKHVTPEEIEDELEKQELQRLRELAISAKAARAFRQNNCSTYRYKMARGEPIITSQFRETFDDFSRPPFANSARRLNLRYTIGARHRHVIDKRTHIWLWPIDDDDGVPLHQLRKEAPPQQKDDRRGARERSRPPLRRHAKADRTKPRRVARGEGRAKKMPWNYGAPNTPLLASMRDRLFQDESTGERKDGKRESADRSDQKEAVLSV